MFDNLYTFKKKGFHSRAFKWIYGVDPVERFPTMCPYSWSWVFTIAFSFIIIPIRLLIPKGKELNEKLLNSKKSKERKDFLKMIVKAQKARKKGDLKTLYCIYNSKLFGKFQYSDFMYNHFRNLSKNKKSFLYTLESSIMNGDKEYRDMKDKKVNERREVRQEFVDKSKDFVERNPMIQKVTFFILFTATGFGILALLYFIFKFFASVPTETYVNFSIGVAFLLSILAISYGIYLLLKDVDIKNTLVSKGLCSTGNFIWKSLGSFGRGFINFFVIIGDMAYKIYKKQCPRITWED